MMVVELLNLKTRNVLIHCLNYPLISSIVKVHQEVSTFSSGFGGSVLRYLYRCQRNP